MVRRCRALAKTLLSRTALLRYMACALARLPRAAPAAGGAGGDLFAAEQLQDTPIVSPHPPPGPHGGGDGPPPPRARRGNKRRRRARAENLM